jgi:5'-methylthioadenosine phosphorylase
MMTLVIFGGTAAYSINPADFAQVVETQIIDTPYGRSPKFLQLRTSSGATVWFSSRHGENSLQRSARFVNHQANVWAARALGAETIFSWNGVGAINPTLRVGHLVIPQAIMDWTRHRRHSFGPHMPHVAQAQALRRAARSIDHINSGGDARQTARPFAEPARRAFWQAAAKLALVDQGSTLEAPTYVCTEGPRLETAAEIQLAADLGADVVGMTLCPEVWLAVEAGLEYASLCLVTNFATGRRHIDPRRDFGPAVAERALKVLLEATDLYNQSWPDEI